MGRSKKKLLVEKKYLKKLRNGLELVTKNVGSRSIIGLVHFLYFSIEEANKFAYKRRVNLTYREKKKKYSLYLVNKSTLFV